MNWRIRGFVFWCHEQVRIVPEHVSFKKKVKYSAVILVTPNQDFGNGSQSFHQQAFVWLCYRLVLVQDWVQVLQMFQGVGIFGLPYASKESSIFKHFFLQKSFVTVSFCRFLYFSIFPCFYQFSSIYFERQEKWNLLEYSLINCSWYQKIQSAA